MGTAGLRRAVAASIALITAVPVPVRAVRAGAGPPAGNVGGAPTVAGRRTDNQARNCAAGTDLAHPIGSPHPGADYAQGRDGNSRSASSQLFAQGFDATSSIV